MDIGWIVSLLYNAERVLTTSAWAPEPLGRFTAEGIASDYTAHEQAGAENIWRWASSSSYKQFIFLTMSHLCRGVRLVAWN